MNARNRSVVFPAAALVMIGCVSAAASGCQATPQPPVSNPTTPQPVTVAPPRAAPLAPARVRSNPSKQDPSINMYRLTDPIEWKSAKLSDEGPEFYYAQADVLTEANDVDRVRLTIIVGSIGKIGACVAPPLHANEKAVPGVLIEHCPHTDADPKEVVTIHRGVLCVHAEPCGPEVSQKYALKGQKGNQFPIWPFILRTPAIPAGAYSGEFVALTVNLTSGVNRMYVFRPNQDAFGSGAGADCTKSSALEITPKTIVYAHPDGGANLTLTQTSCIVMEGGKAPPTTTTPIVAPEDKFLGETCEFFKKAMGVIAQPAGKTIHFDCFP